RRALYQAGMFGAVSLFWTTTPLLLSRPAFGFSQSGIALFALAGAAGAIASPIAGRLADRGLTKAASTLAMVLAMVSFL
ncbi:MFS transporter, partial [Rhizobium sp. SIMBA_035]